MAGPGSFASESLSRHSALAARLIIRSDGSGGRPLSSSAPIVMPAALIAALPHRSRHMLAANYVESRSNTGRLERDCPGAKRPGARPGEKKTQNRNTLRKSHDGEIGRRRSTQVARPVGRTTLSSTPAGGPAGPRPAGRRAGGPARDRREGRTHEDARRAWMAWNWEPLT